MPFKDPVKLAAYRIRDRAKLREKRAQNPELFRARARELYALHREAQVTRKRAYRAGNRERYAELSRQQYKRDRLLILARHQQHQARYRRNLRRWRKAHPAEAQVQVARYRARKRNAAINDFTGAQWEELKKAYHHCCVYCGRKMRRLTQDHIVPLVKGGNHTLSNIVPACQSCNSRKHVNTPIAPIQGLLLPVTQSPHNQRSIRNA